MESLHVSNTPENGNASSVPGRTDRSSCTICKVDDDVNVVKCGSCSSWVHQRCIHMSDVDFRSVKNALDSWY